MTRSTLFRLVALAVAASGLATGAVLGQRSPAEQGKGASIERTLRASAESLRTYEWIETTVVTVRGKEQLREQRRCWYGADGALSRVVVGEPADDRKLEEYLAQVRDALGRYVPLDPERIRAARSAGKAIVTVHDDASLLWLEIPSLVKLGDLTRVEIDPRSDRLVALAVTTYLESAKDVLTLDVRFGALEDGTTYPATLVVSHAAKDVRIALENTGYTKHGS